MQQSFDVIVTLDGVEPVVYGWAIELGNLDLQFPEDHESRARIAAAMIECLQQIQAEALKRAAERVAS